MRTGRSGQCSAAKVLVTAIDPTASNAAARRLDSPVIIFSCLNIGGAVSCYRRGLGGNRFTAQMVAQQFAVAGDAVVASEYPQPRPEACGIVGQNRLAQIPLEPLDAPRNAKQMERLEWDVRRGMSAIFNHPWIPTSGTDAVTVRGFIYDVDTGKLEEVSYPGPMGSIG